MKIKLNSVIVRDRDSALRFDTEILGLEKKTEIPAGDSRWLMRSVRLLRGAPLLLSAYLAVRS